jgi:hypothetical protein
MAMLEFTWEDWLSEKMYGEDIKADGYEDAFLGICRSPGHQSAVAAYDYDKCIEILMDRDGMTYEDAVDFFGFNTMGAYVGPDTPHYVERFAEE